MAGPASAVDHVLVTTSVHRLARHALAVLAVAALSVGCGADAPTSDAVPPPPPAAISTSAPVTTFPDTTTTPAASPLAEAVQPIGSALYEEPADPAPAPISLTIADLGVEAAPVVDVGVLDNGDMEIPGADEIGWYRFGPNPGENGTAVLAAHIAYNGRDGVFRNLTQLQPGDVVEVGFADGSTRRFAVTELAQYPKDQLPAERVFAREGSPELALITCGGSFNRSLRSYDDNVVAYAEPLD